MPREFDVVIIGAGPAGIFAAIEITRQNPGARIFILEKGRDLDHRNCPVRDTTEPCRRCNPCSTTSGWGGAGAFSDGKLTLSPEVGGFLGDYIGEHKVRELIKYIDGIFMEFGGPDKVYGLEHEEAIEEIKRRAVMAELQLVPAPIRHLGTGRTQVILKNMQDYLDGQGVEIATGTEARELIVAQGRVGGVLLADGREIHSHAVVVAPGREGVEWLTREAQRLELRLAVNPVDLGVRVEVPAAVMQHLTDVIYESKFIFYSRTFDDRVRTFCMNPNGEVVQENYQGLSVVNGHSYAERKTGNTNFALLVSKSFTYPFKEPIAYGKYVAHLANLLGGGIIVQRLGDLTSGRRSTVERIKKGLVRPTLATATPGDLSLVFPYRHLTALLEMLETLDKVAPGVYSRHTLLYGVEAKFYSSRLELNDRLESRIENLYAAGDGAGVTRGLAQAAASGVLVARDIIAKIRL